MDITGGVLTFKSAPDYERPADSGRNNEYSIQILAFWWEPEPVVLAHITRDGDSILATSIGVTHVDLLGLLKTMVVLQRDPETLAGYQQEYEWGHRRGIVPQRGTLS